MCDRVRPTIACVIPTYNRGAVLARAIASALNQSDPADQILVIDDGSTDDTREVVKELPITYLHQDNLGGAAARNTGMQNTDCDWIAFLDSDDEWEPQHIERIRKAIIETQSRAKLYFSDVVLNLSGKTVRMWEYAGFKPAADIEMSESSLEWAFLPFQPMMLQATVVHRAAALSIGGLSPHLTRRHDTHFFFKMCTAHPICAVAGIGAVMSNDDAQGRLTSRWGSNSRVYQESSAQLYADILKGLPKDSKHRPEAARRLAHAHHQLAKIRAGDRAYGRAIAHVFTALRHSPQFTVERILSRAGGSQRTDTPRT